jgi:hypothetical protein
LTSALTAGIRLFAQECSALGKVEDKSLALMYEEAEEEK